MSTNKPHDALFKAAFEHPQHAAALFRSLLPPSAVAAIDWDTLTPVPGSFIGRALNDSHTDLLFSARTKDGRLVYLILEHQSRADRIMPLRVSEYLARIVRRDQKLHKRPRRRWPLPLIIPQVICHNPGGWTRSASFQDMFEPHPDELGLASFFPSFTVLIDNLADLTHEQILARGLAPFQTLTLLVLRDANHAATLLANLEHMAPLFNELLAQSELDAVAQILEYIAIVCSELHFQQFCAKLHEQTPNTEKYAMTMAEELMQRGREKGLQEGLEKGLAKGRQEGLLAVLHKLLARKFGTVPVDLFAQVQGDDPERLSHYIERVLTANSPEAVFAD